MRNFILFVVISVLIVLSFWPVEGQPELLRLHVVAASDEEADQQLKLEVRDAILQNYASKWANCGTLYQVISQARADRALIEQTAQRVAGDTPVHVSIGLRDFPTRFYDGAEVPAGTYAALMVELGAARGANWWCVMFPPMCLRAVEGGAQEALEPAQGEKSAPEITSLVVSLWRKWKRNKAIGG